MPVRRGPRRRSQEGPAEGYVVSDQSSGFGTDPAITDDW